MEKYIRMTAVIASIALVIAAMVIQLEPKTEKKVKTENIAADVLAADSMIVSDGNGVFYNRANGDIVWMDAFERVPEVWLAGAYVLDADENFVLLANKTKDKLVVMNREEKGADEAYEAKANSACFTENAIFYINSDNGFVVKIDRETAQQRTIIEKRVKKIEIFNSELMYTQENGTGVTACDFDGETTEVFAEGTVVDDFMFSDNCLYFSDEKNKNQIKKISFNYNKKLSDMKNMNAETFCFCKGVLFYAQKGKQNTYSLMANIRDEQR